jgi:Zn ribbon nucleic-acid-binding protein
VKPNIEAYTKSDLLICPFCGSDDISIHLYNGDVQPVECFSCGESWGNILIVVGISHNNKEYNFNENKEANS